jgi:putative ABC transport system ATP-binding protein
MNTLLEFIGISKRRGRGLASTLALNDINLEIKAGEVLLVEGPSGSGKTTLLGVAAGLLSPDRGSVRLAGQPLGADPKERREMRNRNVGFIFQRSNLIARLTAHQNVMLMALSANMCTADARHETQLLLRRLGITDIANRRPGEMSGGQEQRVAVARALVHRPLLVLADEPTGNLDAAAGQSVAELLTEIARERGSAVLIATHDQRLLPVATRRILLKDGSVSPAEVPS